MGHQLNLGLQDQVMTEWRIFQNWILDKNNQALSYILPLLGMK